MVYATTGECELIRALLTGTMGAGGAAWASSAPAVDPTTQRFMNRIIEGTPLDPSTLQYAQEGLDPMWAFASLVVMGMGPHIAAGGRKYLEDRSADKSRRVEAELSGRVEGINEDDLT